MNHRTFGWLVFWTVIGFLGALGHDIVNVITGSMGLLYLGFIKNYTISE